MSNPDEFVRALARAKTLVAEAQFAREDGDYVVAVDALQEAVERLDQTGWLADVQSGQPLTELHKEIARALANCQAETTADWIGWMTRWLLSSGDARTKKMNDSA